MKEFLLVISEEEITNFQEGKPIVKQSADRFGPFDLTVVVTRKQPIHKYVKEGIRAIESDGEYIYRGFTITDSSTSDQPGYRSENHSASTLNELLHMLDTHENLDFAQKQIEKRCETFYNGHSIKPCGIKYVVDNTNNFYDTVLDALHAIDLDEC